MFNQPVLTLTGSGWARESEGTVHVRQAQQVAELKDRLGGYSSEGANVSQEGCLGQWSSLGYSGMRLWV